jgi:dihydrofolate reductase
MSKLVVTEYLTLDGVMENPGQWSFPYWNDEAARFKYDELFASEFQLLGRVTYEGFAAAWPTMKDTGDFGERMNGMPKYVVSATLQNPTWNNTTVIRSNLIAEVQQLKQQPGKNILVAGSSVLVLALMQHNLIDDYWFMIHPLVRGGGKRLFKEGTEAALKLVEAKTTSGGIAILHYQPAEK